MQQLQKFRQWEKQFARQHTQRNQMTQTREELRASVLAAIPPEELFQAIPPLERVKG